MMWEDALDALHSKAAAAVFMLSGKQSQAADNLLGCGVELDLLQVLADTAYLADRRLGHADLRAAWRFRDRYSSLLWWEGFYSLPVDLAALSVAVNYIHAKATRVMLMLTDKENSLNTFQLVLDYLA
jgi:hypothetical protein